MQKFLWRGLRPITKLLSLIGIFSLICFASASGQVTITSTSAVTENFNGIGTSTTASLPSGFSLGGNGSGATFSAGATATTRSGGTSGTGAFNSGSAGGLYNLADGVTASSSDRALGWLTSGSFSSPGYLHMKLLNSTGSTITALTITFDYEKYRTGTRAWDMGFDTSSSGTSFGTSVSAGAQSYAADGATGTAINPPSSISKSVTLSSLNIASGSSFYVRWSYTGSGGSSNSQAIGVDNISITATVASSGCSGTPAHATSSASPSSVCSSGSTTLSLSGHSSGSGYTYQWQSASSVGGPYSNLSGASSTSYATGALTTSTYYRCITTCTTASTYDTSSVTSVSVTGAVTPSVTIAASPSGAVCSGTSVTFTATATNGGSSPGYQWKKGGVSISGATNVTYSYAPANGDVITCVLTSSAGCASPTTATSSGITETVNPTPSPTISGTATITSGSSTALSFTGNSGDVVYYWDGASTLTTTISGAGTSSVTVSPTTTTTYSVTSATSSAGCSQTITGEYAIITVGTSSPSDTIPSRDNNLALGNPSGATTATTDSNNYLMENAQFSLAYNNSRGASNWVSWHLSRAWKGSAARCDCFSQDTRLPSGYYRASTSHYTSSGFDRGHMCPSDDRDASDTDNAATFLMTNIVPQAPFLNQQPWNTMENYIRNLIDRDYEMYIIAGNYGSGGTGSAGSATTIHSGDITVPSHTYKVVVAIPVGVNDLTRINSSTRVFATDMPNVQSVSTHAWEEYKISVDSLETLTGYNFLSNLSTTVQSSIESNAEVTLAGWDFRDVSGSTTSMVANNIHPQMDPSTSSSLNTLTRGSGASATSASDAFSTTGFGSSGISTSGTKYFQMKIKAASGYTVSLSGIDAAFTGTSTYYASPGVTSQFAYSLDGSTFTLIGSPFTSTNLGTLFFDCSGVSALQNVSSSTTIYIRYYASGQTSGGSWGFKSADTGVYGVALLGHLNQVPVGCSGTPAAGTVSASPSSVCSGGTTTNTLSGHSTGSGYTYQWQSSSTGSSYSNISGATNTTYTTPTLTATAYYRCVTTCTTSATSNTSTPDTVTISTAVTPSVSIAASPSGTICSGTSVTFTATPVNGGSSPSYQWKKNGVNVSGATNVSYSYSPANNDTIRCVLTSSAACASPTTATSSNIINSVTASVSTSVSVAASPSGAVCSGTSVTYTATPTNGGGSPAYQWVKNGSSVSGATSGTYTYTPTDGDLLYCNMTSSATCPSPAVAASNTLTATVNPTTPVVGSISGSFFTTVGGTTNLTSSTGGGSWASATTSVATVNASGVVTGVSLGTAIISYTVTTACGSNFDTAIVTVGTAVAATIADTAWSGMTASSAAGPSTFATVPAASAPGSSVVNVSQWNRVGLTNTSATGTYNSASWSTGTSLSQAKTDGKYLFFTITNNSSTEVKLTSVVINGQRSGTGPATIQAQYRVAGSGADQDFGSSVSTPTSSGNITMSGSLCIAPGQSDTIKVYGWGGSSSAGTFRVNNSSYIKAVYVTGVSALSVTSSSNSGPVCSGSSLSLSGGTASNGYSPYTYSWNGPASYSSTAQSPSIASATATAAGTYTFTVTDNLGCTALNNTTAAITALPTVTATPVASAICSGSNTNITASGATTYSWVPSAGLSASTGSTVTASPTTTTTYTITGTASGCSNTGTQTITVNAVPVLTVTPVSSTICSGSNTSITASGAATYSWLPASSLSSSTGATVTASPGGNTTYTVTGVSAGCSGNQSVTIAVTANPTVTVTATRDTLCAGSSTTLTASGAATYSWSPSTGLSATTGASVIYSGTATADIVATGTLSGCSGATNHNITVYPYYVWAGGAGASWSAAANWNCGAVPTVTDSVVVPFGAASGAVVSASVSVKGLSVAPFTNVSVSASGVLHIVGDLDLNGSIIGSGVTALDGSLPQQISGAGNVRNLLVNNAAGVSIQSGSRLTIDSCLTVSNGVFATSDSLIMGADTILTSRIAPLASTATISGSVRVMQGIQGGFRRYRFWSHPFSDTIPYSQIQQYVDVTGQGGATNGFTTTGTNAPSAYRYNTLMGNSTLSYDPGWRPITSALATAGDTNKIAPYQGVRVYIRGAKGQGLSSGSYYPSATVIAQQGHINQGRQRITLVKGSSTGQDYNFLGNPYASPVDIGTVLFNAASSGNILASFYVWNPSLGSGGQFQSYPISTISPTPYYLPANGAFEVRAAHNGDSLVFNETDKGDASTSNLLRKQPDWTTIYVYDAAYHPCDLLQIRFDGSASDLHNGMSDADKLMGGDLNLYSLSADGRRQAIDVRPYRNDAAIPLGITSNYVGTYHLSADQLALPEGASLYLHDRLLHTYTTFDQGSVYSFEITKDPASSGNDRFELTMKPGASAVADSVSMFIAPNPARDEVRVTVTGARAKDLEINVSNLMGRSVFHTVKHQVQAGIFTVPLQQMAAGVYIVEIVSGEQKVTRRIVKE